MKPSSIGIGFSHHRVPSLSKVATRSSGGTNPAPPLRVADSTNATIALRVAVSRQEGRGSVRAGTQLPSSARQAFTAAIVGWARVIGPHPGRVIPVAALAQGTAW